MTYKPDKNKDRGGMWVCCPYCNHWEGVWISWENVSDDSVICDECGAECYPFLDENIDGNWWFEAEKIYEDV